MTLQLYIEKKIPIPPVAPRTGPRAKTAVWWRMKVGDSVFVPGRTTMNATLRAPKQAGRVFTIRRVDGGCRVWRVG